MQRLSLGEAGAAVLALTCVFAIVVGGWRERGAALLLFAATAATLVAQRLTGRPDPLAALIAVDLATMTGLVRLTWRSERPWPVLAAAGQGIGLALHAIRAASPGTPAWAYLAALNIAHAATVLALAAGAWGCRRRRRRGLSD